MHEAIKKRIKLLMEYGESLEMAIQTIEELFEGTCEKIRDEIRNGE